MLVAGVVGVTVGCGFDMMASEFCCADCRITCACPIKFFWEILLCAESGSVCKSMARLTPSLTMNNRITAPIRSAIRAFFVCNSLCISVSFREFLQGWLIVDSMCNFFLRRYWQAE